MLEKNLAPVAHKLVGVGSIGSDKNWFGQLWIKVLANCVVYPECDTGATYILDIPKMPLGFN